MKVVFAFVLFYFRDTDIRYADYFYYFHRVIDYLRPPTPVIGPHCINSGFKVGGNYMRQAEVPAVSPQPALQWFISFF